MSTNRVIDYTRMRKGTRIRATTRIAVCPKCGRKGELGEQRIAKGQSAGKIAGLCIHTTEVVDGYMRYERVIDSCHWTREDDE